MGQYVPVRSFVHSLDPRAKLLSLVMFIVAVFSSRGLLPLLCGAFVLLGIARLARIPALVMLRSCRPVLFLTVFTFVFNAWAILRISGAESLPAALREGTAAGSRLLLLVLFAVLLPLTTTPMEMTDGFEALLSPFKRLGFPAHECAMMMGVALRFIPLLTDEADRIVKAQLSRGAELDQGNIVRRMIAFFPVLIPLFVIIFRRAEELALAMEARGYRGSEGRTRRRPLVWKKSDTGATIFTMCAIAVFVVFSSFASFASFAP
jgi:energy-coupling factor transport system permease protein